MPVPLFETLQSVGLPAPHGILQVGASYGQEFKQFLENGVRCGVFIEPLKEPFDHLAGICRQVPGWIAVNALAADVAGDKHTFHVASNAGMSSSILAPKKHLDVFDYVKFEHTTELTSTTVDDIVQVLQNNGHGNVVQGLDTLFMDVQGAEYKVLLGATKTLRRMNYVFTELIRGELYDGMMPLVNYITFMEAQGFVLNALVYNQHHHADALFVNKRLLGLK